MYSSTFVEQQTLNEGACDLLKRRCVLLNTHSTSFEYATVHFGAKWRILARIEMADEEMLL